MNTYVSPLNTSQGLLISYIHYFVSYIYYCSRTNIKFYKIVFNASTLPKVYMNFHYIYL